MKLIGFNVNGVRASANKGLHESLRKMDADIFCFQEVKASEQQTIEALGDIQDYHIHVHSAERPGYSGTAILSREMPVRVDYGLDCGSEHLMEGRVITATFSDHIVVNCYAPNSGADLKRLQFKKLWCEAMREHLVSLAQDPRPVIFTGDLNVAHQEIDIARPAANYNKTAGYTQIEIDALSELLGSGFADTFRHLHPAEVKYSWWNQRFGARAKNLGWRIDYVLVTQAFMPKVKSAFILNEVMGSDHCPVGIEW
ncbi:MAG: exodeoxyribonuclease III [Bacteroidota bacterium]|nr:exodeoxyribonuclease III [Bacteroidota bacterium]